MSDAMIRIFARVVARRVAAGEAVDDVLASYPKLTDDDKTKIKALL